MKILKTVGQGFLFIVIYALLFIVLQYVGISDGRTNEEMAKSSNFVQTYLLGISIHCTKGTFESANEYICLQGFNPIFWFVNLVYSLIIYFCGQLAIRKLQKSRG